MRGGAPRGELPLFAGFLLTGVLTVLLGPLISELLARELATQPQTALLFPSQFVLSSIGSVLSSWNLRRSLQIGYFSAACGLAVLSLLDWPLLVPGAALLGLGLGLCIPATNLLVARRHAERPAAALAVLNLVWSLGAVGCPLLFATVVEGLPLRALLAGLAILAAAAGAIVASFRRREPSLAVPEAEDGVDEIPIPVPRLVALGAMLLLYVGAESSIGGWLVTLADRIGGERTLASLLIGSGFWAALLVGRATTPIVLRLLTERALFFVALALAAVGTLTVLFAATQSAVATGALAAGLGLAPLFPLTVSRIAGETRGGSRRTGWVFAGSGLGGASLPWLTERLGGAAASLQAGFAVPLCALGVLALLALRPTGGEVRGERP